VNAPTVRPAAPRLDWRDDRGQVAGIEAIPFGLLLFVAGALLVANAWAVIDAKMAVSSAAREAARSYVEAADDRTGRAAANTAAVDAVRAYGRDPSKLSLSLPENATAPSDPFRRCQRITFQASYPVPALTIPLIGGFGSGFVVTASHSEIVDPYRDAVGPPGEEAACG
jgi:hypothetical protein